MGDEKEKEEDFGRWGRCRALVFYEPGTFERSKEGRPCKRSAVGEHGLCRMHRVREYQRRKREEERAAREENVERFTVSVLKGKKREFLRWVLSNWKWRRGEVEARFKDFASVRRYLWELYADPPVSCVLKKGTQLGLTELALAHSIWLASAQGKSVIYTLPTDELAELFALTRVDPALGFVPGLAPEHGEGPDNKRVKALGKGLLYIRGIRTDRHAVSIPSDANKYDEVDKSDPRTIARMRSRLGASSDPGEWWLSTPTLPGVGIDKRFEESDQRHWVIKHRCDGDAAVHEFALCCAWPDAVDEHGREERPRIVEGGPSSLTPTKKPSFVCPKCRAPLSNTERNAGVWKPANPGPGRVRGYHISWLIDPTKSAEDVLAYRESAESVQDFYNDVLGLAFAGQSMPASASDILACVDRRLVKLVSSDGCYLGADQGDEVHVIIGRKGHSPSDRPSIVHWEKISGPGRFERIHFLFRQFGCVAAVIDALPNKEPVEKLAAAYPAKVWMGFYENFADHDPIRWDRASSTVMSRRADVLSEMYDRIVTKAIAFPSLEEDGQDLVRQLASMKREIQTDRFGRKVIRYVKTGPDHYAHALSNLLIAMQSNKRPLFRIIDPWASNSEASS